MALELQEIFGKFREIPAEVFTKGFAPGPDSEYPIYSESRGKNFIVVLGVLPEKYIDGLGTKFNWELVYARSQIGDFLHIRPNVESIVCGKTIVLANRDKELTSCSKGAAPISERDITAIGDICGDVYRTLRILTPERAQT
jgi:hypothetical protein